MSRFIIVMSMRTSIQNASIYCDNEHVGVHSACLSFYTTMSMRVWVCTQCVSTGVCIEMCVSTGVCIEMCVSTGVCIEMCVCVST